MLSKSGMEVAKKMMGEYGKEKGKKVFYASMNKGNPGSSKWEVRAAAAKSLLKKKKK
jgi:hypothetical protein